MRKAIILCGLLLACLAQAVAQNVTRIEYFVDTDPGFGNGISVSFTPAATVSNLTFNVNVASLTAGFHTLYVRSKNAVGVWGITHNTVLYKSSSVAADPLSNVTRLEYFIDTDPGFGNGTNVPVTPATTINQVFNVPVNAVADGFHILYVRSRSASGKWSVTHNTMFYKVPAVVGSALPNLKRLEYFVDTDPGEGNGTALTFTPGTSVSNLVFNVNASALAVGTHKLYIRAKDMRNSWSVVAISDFNVCNHPATTVNAATSVTSSSFVASWADVPGSISYQIDVSTDNFATFVSGYNAKVITAPALTTTVTGLSQATTYQYRVRAVAACASVISNVVSLTTLDTPPTSQPSNLLFSSVTATSFTAFFTAASPAPTGYLVVRKAGSASAFVPATNTTYTLGQNTGDGIVASVGTTNILNESGLSPNTQYFYRIFSFNQFNGATSYLTTSPLQNNVRTTALEPTAQPTNLQFTSVTDVSFTVSYTAATGNPDGYIVLRKVDSTPTSVPVDGTTYTTTVGTDAVVHQGSATSFAQTGLTQNTNYFYSVYAYNGTGTAINYRAASPLQGNQLTPITPPAAAPTNLIFSNVTPNALTVSFTAAAGSPTGYIVVRKTGSNPAFVPQSNTTYTPGQILSDGVVAYVGSGTTFNESGLTPSTTYFYDVFAYNQIGGLISYQIVSPLEGSKTTFTAEPTAQATQLVFSAVTTTGLTLSFTAASPAPGGYVVIRKAGSAPTSSPVDGNAYTVGQTLPDGTVAFVGSATSFNDSGLSSGVLYFYQVFSVNGSGAASNYLTTLSASNSGSKITVPGKPVFNTPNTAIGQNQFTISWVAVTGAVNYRVDVSKDNFASYVPGFQNVTVNSTSIAITGLETGVPYKYRVRAVNDSGTSANSDEGQQFTIPATPVLTSATNPGQTSFTANWNAVTGVTGYFLDVSLSSTFADFVAGYQNKPLAIVTSENITGLAPGKTYYYRLRSTNSGGTSPDSNPIGSQLLVPATPVATQPDNVTSSAFKALWNEVLDGVTEYRIDVALLANDFNTSSLPNYTNKKTDANTEQLVTLLSANTAYKYRVRAVNATGASPSSNVVSVSTLELGGGNSPQVSSLTAAEEFEGTPVNIIAQITGGLAPYLVKLYYRKISATDFSVRTLTSTNTTYTTTADATMFDDLGLEFYVTVTDANLEEDESDRKFIYKSIPAQTKIPFTKSGGTAESYEMFSIPYAITNDLVGQIFEEMGGIDKSKWRLVRYQGGKNVDLSESSKIEPGKGYWFNRKENTEVSFAGSTVVKQNQATPFVLQLEQGLNQIGNPFPFNIDWSDVLAANPTQATQFDAPTYLKFDASKKGFTEANDLPEWGAGFVFTENAVTINLPVTLKNSASGGRKKPAMSGRLDNDDWVVPLTFSHNDAQIDFIGLGMHPEASLLKDPFDKMTPPRFMNYLEWDTKHDDYFYPFFSRDVVPTANQYTWTFTAQSSEREGDAKLVWDKLSLGENDAQLVLLDVESMQWVNMKTIGEYRFRLNGPKTFKIYYSRNSDAIQPLLSGVGAAFPNPLMNSTNIPVVVNARTWTDVSIYDMTGKKIKTILAGDLEAGFHHATWDGQDVEGNKVASGLYFYRLTLSGRFVGMNRIIVR